MCTLYSWLKEPEQFHFPMKNIQFRHTFYLFCFLLIGSSVAAQNQLATKIDVLLAAECPDANAPGMTIGVIQENQLIYQGYRGLSNVEYTIPYNDSTLFSVASITKQFTSACIGVLEHRNLLSVNDDVRKYIPELNFYGDTIRIRHLLNHTSGLRNHNVLLDLQGFDYAQRGYNNRMIEELMFRQKDVNNRPGEKMLYSNTNYVLLALIVERVSGNTLNDFAQQALFEPLGMSSTAYVNDRSLILSNKACSYYSEAGELKRSNSLSTCIGAGGVVTNMNDMAQWSAALMGKNKAFAYITDFLKTQDLLLDGSVNACARGVFCSSYRGVETIHHGGRGIGMRAHLLCVPELNTTIIVFANEENLNASRMAYKVLDSMLSSEEESPSEKVKKYTPKKKEMQSFIGHYQELNSDMQMDILLKNDTLWAKSSFGNTPIPLQAKAKGQFARVGNSSVVYSFNTKFALTVDFGGAVFYFEEVVPVSADAVEMNDFVGQFYSKELNVSYTLTNVSNSLQLSFPNTEALVLHPLQTNTFGSGRRTKYTFIRDASGAVSGFTVAAEGTVKNILFERLP